MKVYSAPICIDCRNFHAVMEKRGLTCETVDITESTANLKLFLHIRDTKPLFDRVRANGGIGIPLFVNDDGRMTLDADEALSWLGQPPVRPDEIAEQRMDFSCAGGC